MLKGAAGLTAEIMFNQIDSASNEKIKHAAKLSQSPKHRKESEEFLLEGLRLCRDAVLTGIPVSRLFFTAEAYEKFGADIDAMAEKSGESYQISRGCAEKLSDTKNSQGVFCVCGTLGEKTESDVSRTGKYIALENIQDPANLGAVCRTAEALGISGAIMKGCCDIYNPKAQRAAMGSLLRLDIIRTDDLRGLLLKLKSDGMSIYSTTPDPSAVHITETDMSGGVVAVIGNEGSGVTDETAEVCEKITIPMKGRAESLNASMAAAITMWEIMR